MSKNILILSTGRTGTKYFAKLFEQSEKIEAHHASKGTPLINIISNMVLTGYLPKFFLSLLWDLTKSGEVLGCKKEIYLDSNNHLFAFPLLLPQKYNTLKVVHIIRDPRNYAKSHINWIHEKKKSYIADSFIPFWQPNPFLLGDRTFSQWRKQTQLQKFAWIWNYKNQLMFKIKETSTPYFFFKFEDYFQESNIELHIELLKFIGVDKSQINKNVYEKENRTSNSLRASWEEWTDTESALFHLACGKTMNRHGYGSEPQWISKVEKGLTLLKSEEKNHESPFY